MHKSFMGILLLFGTCHIFGDKADVATPPAAKFQIEYVAGFPGGIKFSWLVTPKFAVGASSSYGWNFFTGTAARTITSGNSASSTFSHNNESLHAGAFVTLRPLEHFRFDLGPRYAEFDEVFPREIGKNHARFIAIDFSPSYEHRFSHFVFAIGFRLSVGRVDFSYIHTEGLSSGSSALTAISRSYELTAWHIAYAIAPEIRFGFRF